jgi:hypothetical protein
VVRQLRSGILPMRTNTYKIKWNRRDNVIIIISLDCKFRNFPQNSHRRCPKTLHLTQRLGYSLCPWRDENNLRAVFCTAWWKVRWCEVRWIMWLAVPHQSAYLRVSHPHESSPAHVIRRSPVTCHWFTNIGKCFGLTSSSWRLSAVWTPSRSSLPTTPFQVFNPF